MANIVLYWAPGSGGDLVQGMMCQTGLRSIAKSFTINQQGKIDFETDQDFRNLFPFDGYWYFRDWTINDIERLDKLDNVIIGTHRLDQVDFLKSNSSVITIGLTYDSSLFLAVLKNWCKKIGSYNQDIHQVYHESSPMLFDMFKKNNSLGEFVLAEQLKFGTNIPTSVDPVFDINLSLGNMYNRDVSVIDKWLNKDSYLMFDQWYNVQDALYRYKFDVTSNYIQALGYNHQATCIADQAIALTSYDRILLNHYCKSKNIEKIKATTNCEAVKLLG